MTPQESVLDFFEEGREARLCNKPRDSNPHPPGSEGHAAWEKGWDDADQPDGDLGRGYR